MFETFDAFYLTKITVNSEVLHIWHCKMTHHELSPPRIVIPLSLTTRINDNQINVLHISHDYSLYSMFARLTLLIRLLYVHEPKPCRENWFIIPNMPFFLGIFSSLML